MNIGNLIKSPMNYTGGKFKLLKQILPLFPEKIEGMFVDLFCGGATVGINMDADTIEMIDKDTGEILLDNTDIKSSTVLYNTDTDGTTVYLGIIFNKEGKEYFEKIIQKYDDSLLDFLANVFPYVDRGIKGNELRPEFDYSSKEINKEIELKCRVASAKYFDLYFY